MFLCPWAFVCACIHVCMHMCVYMHYVVVLSLSSLSLSPPPPLSFALSLSPPPPPPPRRFCPPTLFSIFRLISSFARTRCQTGLNEPNYKSLENKVFKSEFSVLSVLPPFMPGQQSTMETQRQLWLPWNLPAARGTQGSWVGCLCCPRCRWHLWHTAYTCEDYRCTTYQTGHKFDLCSI